MLASNFNMYNLNNYNNVGFNSFSNLFMAKQDLSYPISFMSPVLFNPMGYMGYFDKDFMATMVLFNTFVSNPQGIAYSDKLFDKEFNTKTDLPQLKSVYNANLANSLANIAEKNASKTDTVGYCFRSVRKGLEAAGLSGGEIRGASAYQAKDMLANHKNFKEVKVSRSELNELPAGCVIVWDKSQGHEHGHIGVTLGNGKEASDHIQEISKRNADFAVFVPVGINKSA